MSFFVHLEQLLTLHFETHLCTLVSNMIKPLYIWPFPSFSATLSISGPSRVPSEEKVLIRGLLLENLDEPSEQITRQLGELLARIARSDCPHDWPELLPTLTENVQGGSSLLRWRSLFFLYRVMKTLSSKRLQKDRETFYEVLHHPDTHTHTHRHTQTHTHTNTHTHMHAQTHAHHTHTPTHTHPHTHTHTHAHTHSHTFSSPSVHS